MLRSLLVALFLALTIGGDPAGAAEPAPGLVHELKLGLLAHDTDILWSRRNREDGVDINLEALLTPSWDLELWGREIGTLRPAIGASINTEGDTSKLYLDARLQRDFASGIFVGLGVGAALHDGRLDAGNRERKALGARVLFHIPAEIGYRLDDHHSLSVYFDHVSNAFLADENEGMDTLGLRYGYRF